MFVAIFQWMQFVRENSIINFPCQITKDVCHFVYAGKIEKDWTEKFSDVITERLGG